MLASRQIRTVLEWLVLGAIVGVACGLASALFLWLLELATSVRTETPSLVWGLPFAGLALGALWERFGASIRGGNSLVIDTIHDGGPQLPLRMAPMVLLGTVWTHLFGGSAGREGTAVQMGASLADLVANRLGVTPVMRRQLLAAGVAGGFGSVFGTPFAGALFGLEFVVLGQIQYAAILPALTASVVGDLVTRSLGITHAAFPTVGPVALDGMVALKWIVFAAAMAATTVLFIELTHRLRAFAERQIQRPALRLFVGGAVIVMLWQLFATDTFLGLGVPTILSSFDDPTQPPWYFAAKLLFTAVTLAVGFVGGEVTPLFFVGAALGNALAGPLGLPIDLCAAVGLAAVFAAASNAPLALSVMAVELVGAAVLPHVVIVAVFAWVLTGHRGIYPSQRLIRTKTGRTLDAPTRLADARPARAERAERVSNGQLVSDGDGPTCSPIDDSRLAEVPAHQSTSR